MTVTVSFANIQIEVELRCGYMMEDRGRGNG